MAPPRRTALAGQSTQPHRTTTSARRRRSDQPAAPASSDGDDVNGDAGGLSKVCAASLVALAHPHVQPCASGILPTPTMTTNAPILPFPAWPRTARRGDQRRCGHAPLRVVRPHCRCHVTTRTPPPPPRRVGRPITTTMSQVITARSMTTTTHSRGCSGAGHHPAEVCAIAVLSPPLLLTGCIPPSCHGDGDGETRRFIRLWVPAGARHRSSPAEVRSVAVLLTLRTFANPLAHPAPPQCS